MYIHFEEEAVYLARDNGGIVTFDRQVSTTEVGEFTLNYQQKPIKETENP